MKTYAMYVKNVGSDEWEIAGVYRAKRPITAIANFIGSNCGMFPNAEMVIAKPYNEEPK